MSGTRGHSGRRKRATAQFRGETWVRLSHARSVTSANGMKINRYTRSDGSLYWVVNGAGWNGLRFTDFDAASAEFVRRVNER